MALEHRLNKLKDLVQIDRFREAHTGIPEVIYGEFKSDDQIVEAVNQSLNTYRGSNPVSRISSTSVLVSRITQSRIDRIQRLLPSIYRSEVFCDGGLIRISRAIDSGCSDRSISPIDIPIAVLAAGTSDARIAEEAVIMAEEMGVRVLSFFDLGVSGIHRLIKPLEDCLASDVAAIVVVAGMEAALPTLVRSLVAIPVIGVPTSIGYGVSAGGQVALNTMLASCTPGLMVVNIDNGIGAGASAALIAKRVSRHST